MPIPQLNLDDRNFDQLAAEGRALIPRYFPAWTDYNTSDPGIALLELFAFLIEAAIYQMNRVPDRSLERFAGLAGIQRAPGEPIEQTLRRALEVLKQRYRAVTEADFEALATQAGPAAIARSKALIEMPPDTIVVAVQSASGTTITVAPFNSGIYGLRLGAPVTASSGMPTTSLAQAIPPGQAAVTRIVVQDSSFAASVNPGDLLGIAVQPDVFPLDQFVRVIIVPSNPALSPVQLQALRQQVFQFLAPRRLITTRVKILPPDYTPLAVSVTAVRDGNTLLDARTVAGNVSQALSTFLDPLKGGLNSNGWPFGRSVFRSELDRIIEVLDGVDHVRQLLLNGDEDIGEVKLVSPLSLVNLTGLSVSVVDL